MENKEKNYFNNALISGTEAEINDEIRNEEWREILFRNKQIARKQGWMH